MKYLSRNNATLEIHNAQRCGYTGWGEHGGPVPPLGPEEKKSPADVAYDCWATSGLTTLALAVGNSSLHSNVIVQTHINSAHSHTLCYRSIHITCLVTISAYSTNAMPTTVESNS